MSLYVSFEGRRNLKQSQNPPRQTAEFTIQLCTGKNNNPIKKTLNVRLDADVVEWLKIVILRPFQPVAVFSRS